MMKSGFGYKQKLAEIFGKIGLLDILLFTQTHIFHRKSIRVIAYHATEEKDINLFKKQLHFLRHHFSNVTLDDLDEFMHNHVWKKDKPGIILSFDDGIENNYRIAAPILEELGFTGWFFTPINFVLCERKEQDHFAVERDIFGGRDPEHTEIQAMSAEQLRILEKRGHVIGSHTRSHHRFVGTDTEEALTYEIEDSKRQLEKILGHTVSTFCYPGGEEEHYTADAAAHIKKAGYLNAFMLNSALITYKTDPFEIQRSNVEPSWSLNLLKFQISGLMDLLYLFRRRRVHKKISISLDGGKSF